MTSVISGYNKPKREDVISEFKLCVCSKCGSTSLEVHGRKCYVCEKGSFREVREYCRCCGENITTSRETHKHECQKWIRGSSMDNMFGFA